MDWLEMIQLMEEIRLFSKQMFKKDNTQSQLSRDELDLLSLLVIHDQVTPLLLSQKMKVSKAFISRLIDHLLNEDMLYKVQNSLDKRSYYILISPKGRTALETFYSYYLEPIYTLKKEFSQDDFQTFISLTQKANTILRKDD